MKIVDVKDLAAADAPSPTGSRAPGGPPDPSITEEMSALRRGLDQHNLDLAAQQTVSLEATRRLQQQLTKLEISNEDLTHTVKTSQKDGRYELESVQDLVTTLQQRVGEVQDMPRPRPVAAAPDPAGLTQQMNAILERIGKQLLASNNTHMPAASPSLL